MPAGTDLILLTALVFAAAALYSSGGHAGASAYLGLMGLYGVLPAVMKPTALVLNIAVAAIGAARFILARAVPWRIVIPACAGSMPAAFAGGRLRLAPGTYLVVLGSALLLGAVALWATPRASVLGRPPRPGWLVAAGAVLGFVAGITGIGGGIFLTPLLVLAGWEAPRRTGGAAVTFILANSVLGLLGHASSTSMIPSSAGALGVAAVCGGVIGSWLGVHRLQPTAFRRVNAVILVISGTKLCLDGILT